MVPPRLFFAPFALAFLANAVPAQERAVLVDIRHADTAQVDAWRAADGVRWWLELGDELLLSGDVSAMRAAIDADLVLRDLGPLEPDDLILHARGCSADSAPADLLVWTGSRHDLLLRPDAARMADFEHVDHEHLGAPEWVDVQPGMVVARQYRLDRPAALAADPRIEPLVAAVDTGRWFADVETLATWDRSSYSSELATARLWIAARFSALGLAVSEPAFALGSYTPRNVIGRIDGISRPNDWIIVGGHYDSRNANNSPSGTLDTPGADDNASGCSAVLELARIFTHHRPAATMLFMCYAGEEQGLVGSNAHAGALQAAGDLGKVQLAAIMDMIGWSANENLGAALDTTSAYIATRNLFADAALTYVPGLAVTVSGITCCSDHMPYINRNRPAVLSIHKNYTGYVHYHQTTDLPVNLGTHAQAIGGAIMRMNVAAVAQVAGPMDRIFANGAD